MEEVIDKINRELEEVQNELLSIKAKLETVGENRDYEMVLVNKETALLKKEARLEEKKTKLEGSAPSGNPINLSQSLHKVFECVVVVSFPLITPYYSLNSYQSLFDQLLLFTLILH